MFFNLEFYQFLGLDDLKKKKTMIKCFKKMPVFKELLAHPYLSGMIEYVLAKDDKEKNKKARKSVVDK